MFQDSYASTDTVVREPLVIQRPGSRAGQQRRVAAILDEVGLPMASADRNTALVAQQIHVHPQTVRYRLRQIRELFGDQLRDPDRRFDLQLALRIRLLSGSVTTDGNRERPGPPGLRGTAAG